MDKTKDTSTAEQRQAALAAESKDNETQTRGPVTQQSRPLTRSGDVATAQGLNTEEGRKASIAAEEERLKRLNEQNREGHDKNMKLAEEHGEQAAANSEKGPTSGKEWNRNTPRIDKDGHKHWD
jgi:hypothetical protein